MSFSLRPYTPPDFTQPFLADAPDVCIPELDCFTIS